jgi:signal transduction histidine kinase/putative methionine-R-sulfoxide reductase with GAF domain
MGKRSTASLQTDVYVDEGLSFLLAFSGRLLECSTTDGVFQLTAETVWQRLHCRTCSIFLFSKEGKLERRFLAGLGEELPPEVYERGQGLVGLTIGNSSSFGQAQFSADIQNDQRIQGDPVVRGYLEAYGRAIRTRYGIEEKAVCALAVPFNSLHRSFGVIRIVNRLEPATGRLAAVQFEESARDWLIMMARMAANAVVNLKKQEQLATLATTLQPLDEEDEKAFLARVAKTLTSRSSVYSACLIHAFDRETNELEIFSHSRNFRPLPTLSKQQVRVKVGEGVCGRVFRSGEVEIVPNLLADPKGFLRRDWAEYNGFVSLICLPLKNRRGGHNFGTLQLFTKYEYIFDDDNIRYLESVGHQISTVLRTLQEKKDLHLINQLSERINQETRLEGVLATAVAELPTILAFDRALGVVAPPGAGAFEVISSSDGRQLGAEFDRRNPVVASLASKRKVRVFRSLRPAALGGDFRDLLHDAESLALIPIPVQRPGLDCAILLENLRRDDAPEGRLREFRRGLCQTIASQVSSTISKNELLYSLETETKRQTAIQRVLSKTSSLELGDLESLLAVAIEELVAILAVDVALIGLYSKRSRELDPCVVRGLDDRQVALLRLDEVREPGYFSRAADAAGGAGEGRIIPRHDIRSEIALPLTFSDQPIGLLLLGSCNEGAFDASARSFLETFASGTASNVQNQEFFRAALTLGTLRFAEMRKNEICSVLAEKTSEVMSTPVTCVWLRRRLGDDELLVMRGAHGVELPDRSAFDMKRSEGGLSWQAVLRAEAQIAADCKGGPTLESLHTLHEDIQSSETGFRHPDFAREYDLRSMIIMPIVLESEVVGVINTYARRRYQFFEREIYLLQNLALSGAMALGAADLTQRLSAINEVILETAQIANPGTVALSFSHDISHTISHINALLSSLIELVPKRQQEEPPGHDIIESLTVSTDYLRNLVRSLVKYAGGKPVRYTSTSLREVLEYVRYIYDVRLRANRIDFPKPVLEGGDCWIECDRSQLEQVFINLFNNSIYAIKRRKSKGGVITVSARSLDESFVEIQLRDNGIGIAPDALPHVFDPFFTTKGSEGSGFGLPICRKIVEDNHRGKLSVHSQFQDHTIVFIKLPKRQQAQ